MSTNGSGHLTTVQGIYEAFGRGDVPAILDRVADDVAWESWEVEHHGQKGGVPWLAPRTGRDGVGEFFRVIGEGLRFHSFEVQSMLVGERAVAVTLLLDVEVVGGGRFRDEEIHLWSFDEHGRVSRFRHYVDTAKHLAAAARG